MNRLERIDNLPEAVLAAFRGFHSELWTALPGRIQSFNAAKMTVEVQPTLQMQQRRTDGTWVWVTMPILVDCPVMFPGGGGFTLTFPIAAGDECLVIFASRCIDAWWQSSGIQQQAELRMHDLSDGFAFVGIRSLPRALDALSTANVQLRSDDGEAFVEVTPDHDVRIQTTANVEIEADGDLTATIGGNATIDAGADVEATAGANAAITATGAIALTAPTIALNGDVTCSGTITAVGDVSGAGTSLHTHIHGGVRSGGDLSGGPA